jgi:tetratricopeptide (TPR) repeat protein
MFRFLLLISISIYLCAAPALAWGQKLPNPNKQDKPPHSIAQEKEQLLRSLATRPELMNLNYLQYIIGRPENERAQRGNPTKNHFWYDSARNLTYELYQTEAGSGQVVESIFVSHLQNCGITLDEVQKGFGANPKEFYDYNSNPTALYSFSPNTCLAFTAPRNTFAVKQAKIVYRGTPLAAPLPAEMQAVQDAFINKALLHVQQGNHADAIPMLQTIIAENPSSARGHLALAQAYASQTHIHDAINQYKIALALAPADGTITGPAMAGLQALRAVPVSASTGNTPNY